MRRMLISCAAALALVATLGVHEALAAKGKEKRNPGNPLRIRLRAENLTTGESGKSITASAGDQVKISLRVDNRTGEDQNASITVSGGIPGCPVNTNVLEFFAAGQRKEDCVVGVVPEGESGLLEYTVDVLMVKSGDTESQSGSVAFGGALKGDAPEAGGIFHRIFARMMLRSLLQLSDDGSADISTTSMSALKGLYR